MASCGMVLDIGVTSESHQVIELPLLATYLRFNLICQFSLSFESNLTSDSDGHILTITSKLVMVPIT